MGDRIDVNSAVAKRIRQRRRSLGLTQSTVASDLGISFQQVHRLESGENQITVSRLWGLANALGVPVEYFFYELSQRAITTAGNTVSHASPR